MPWWNVIDFRDRTVDKKLLPVLILVVIVVSVATEWAIETFGWIAFPFILTLTGAAAVAEVRTRRKHERQQKQAK